MTETAQTKLTPEEKTAVIHSVNTSLRIINHILFYWGLGAFILVCLKVYLTVSERQLEGLTDLHGIFLGALYFGAMMALIEISRLAWIFMATAYKVYGEQSENDHAPNS